MSKIKFIESPIGIIQSTKKFVTVEDKVRYIQMLLNVGFDTINLGNFASYNLPFKSESTEDILQKLDVTRSKSKLLLMVDGEYLAKKVCQYDQIFYLGYFFPASKKHTDKAFVELNKIINISKKHGKSVVTYLPIDFGNFYDESPLYQVVNNLVLKFSDIGVEILNISDISDTVSSKDISEIFKCLINNFINIEFGAYFHTLPTHCLKKIDEAYTHGCKRFETSISGFRGLPMSNDNLIENVPTERLINYFASRKVGIELNLLAFESAINEFFRVKTIGCI